MVRTTGKGITLVGQSWIGTKFKGLRIVIVLGFVKSKAAFGDAFNTYGCRRFENCSSAGFCSVKSCIWGCI